LWKGCPLAEALRYGRGMRLPAVLAVTLTMLVLTGCGTPEPVVVPEPESSSTPLFASDEEALAAAEEAYGAYLAVSDQILAEGGINPERAYGYMTENMRSDSFAGIKLFVDSEWHTQGATTFDSMTLQQFSQDETTEASLVAYACLDVSGLRIIDVAGTDVTPLERPSRLPLELEFVAEASSTMLIERSDLWSGEDFC